MFLFPDGIEFHQETEIRKAMTPPPISHGNHDSPQPRQYPIGGVSIEYRVPCVCTHENFLRLTQVVFLLATETGQQDGGG